jgi:hypothetical protein
MIDINHFGSVLNEANRINYFRVIEREREKEIDLAVNSKMVSLVKFLIVLLNLASFGMSQECYESDKVIIGATLAEIDVLFDDDCCDFCSDFDGCTGYAFDQASGVCTLIDRSGLGLRLENQGTSVTYGIVSRMECFEENGKSPKPGKSWNGLSSHS